MENNEPRIETALLDRRCTLDEKTRTPQVHASMIDSETSSLNSTSATDDSVADSSATMGAVPTTTHKGISFSSGSNTKPSYSNDDDSQEYLHEYCGHRRVFFSQECRVIATKRQSTPVKTRQHSETTASIHPGSQGRIITTNSTNGSLGSETAWGERDKETFTLASTAGAISKSTSPAVISSPSETRTTKSHWRCCICLDIPALPELSSLNGCGHTFCFDCIEKWAERENTCPLCKVRFTKINRVHKQLPIEQEQGGGVCLGLQPKDSKQVTDRNQTVDEDQIRNFNYTLHTRLESVVHGIKTLTEHYHKNEKEIRSLIEQSRNVERKIASSNKQAIGVNEQNEFLDKLLHERGMHGNPLERMVLIEHYRTNERKIKAVIERSQHIESGILEIYEHIDSLGQYNTSADLLFRRLKREMQTLTEHYTNSERKILSLIERVHNIERDTTNRHNIEISSIQDGFNTFVDNFFRRDKERKFLINRYRSNEAIMNAIILYSYDMEVEMGAFVDLAYNSIYSSHSPPPPIPSESTC